MPSLRQSCGEAPRDVGAQALLDVVQDLVVAGFVADQQQAQAVVLHDLQGLVGHVGLGVAAPGHAELAHAARDRFDARQVGSVGEGVVVEHDLLHFGHVLLDPLHFGEDVLGRAHPVAMAADGLRPQAERALRAAAAARVEAHIGMLQVADEVVLDLQIALVDGRHERQLVHVLDHRARQVVHDAAVGVAIGEALDVLRAAARRRLPCRCSRIPRGRRNRSPSWLSASRRGSTIVLAPTRPIRIDGLRFLQQLGEARIGRKRRRAGVHDDEVVAARDREALLDRQLVGGRIEHA